MSETKPLLKPNIAIVCDCGIKIDNWIVDFESSGIINIEDLNLHNGMGHKLYIKTIPNSKNYKKGIEVYCVACGKHVHINNDIFIGNKKFRCEHCGNDSWSDDIE